MKKHSAVLMLFSRSTFHWVVLLLLVLAICQGLLFHFAYGALYEQALLDELEMVGMEVVFAESGMAWAFGAAFLLLCALLSLVGCEFRGKQGYTLMRLSLDERWIFFWQAVYNSLCFFLLWAAQAGIALALCQYYVARVGEAAAGSQAIFLAFYRSRFLHGLLPLEDAWCWARNILLALGLGAACASLPYAQRHGKRPGVEQAAMCAVAILAFVQRNSGFFTYMLTMLFSLLLLGLSLYRALGEGRGDPYEN